MDVKNIITELREEHARVTQAILALEAVERAKAVVKRRGRPPGVRNKPKATSRPEGAHWEPVKPTNRPV